MNDKTKVLAKEALKVVKETIVGKVTMLNEYVIGIESSMGSFLLVIQCAAQITDFNDKEGYLYSYTLIFPKFLPVSALGKNSLARINEVNRSLVFGNFYVDEEGDVSLDIAILLEEGEFTPNKLAHLASCITQETRRLVLSVRE
ncbi:TPA: YbjN domain-containing protein [Burkholderia vietnamiensis]|nr:YbjN domain-containing protein [Burkholderia vietnamiensis]